MYKINLKIQLMVSINCKGSTKNILMEPMTVRFASALLWAEKNKKITLQSHNELLSFFAQDGATIIFIIVQFYIL